MPVNVTGVKQLQKAMKDVDKDLNKEMSKNILKSHKVWMETPGAKGQAHNDNSMRTVRLPPKSDIAGWNVAQYKNRWDIIEELLK